MHAATTRTLNRKPQPARRILLQPVPPPAPIARASSPTLAQILAGMGEIVPLADVLTDLHAGRLGVTALVESEIVTLVAPK